MKYTMTFLEEDYLALVRLVSSDATREQAAYLLCRPSISPEETRLLVREVIPVEDDCVLESSSYHMKIAPLSYIRILKKAHFNKSTVVFVHSHPRGVPSHSEQDDVEEKKLFSTAYVRIKGAGPHASLIVSDGSVSAGRVWLADGSAVPIERIRRVGKQFEVWPPISGRQENIQVFDRQIRAFGHDTQALLGRLHIGIVGAGGTGSAIAEQLIRLGVGNLIVSDGDAFESSNVNRVYGSRISDEGVPKVDIVSRSARKIGTGTDVRSVDRPISFESAIKEFRNCDIVFGCTDDELGRSLLSRLAIYYYIPVFDMGVKIDATEGRIRSIQGRVTTLMPHAACLSCRGRLSAERISAEARRTVNPDEAQRLENEGYIAGVNAPAPAVISFTSTIASSAVTEFLHRLTGFLGADRETTEVIHLIDQTSIRRNHVPAQENCFCGDRYYWGRGDVTPFLDSTWRPE